jgi:hypothetical protein
LDTGGDALWSEVRNGFELRRSSTLGRFLAQLRTSRAHQKGPVSGVMRTRFAQVEFFASCEGFRMPAARKRCDRHRWPASESLQGRKPRWGNEWWCRARYGDLSAADAAFELRRSDRADCATLFLPRMSSLRWKALAFCKQGRSSWGRNCVFERVPPWPVEGWRRKRAFRHRDAGLVMTCRA